MLNGTYRRRSYLNADGTPKPVSEFASERAIAENRPINDVETGIVTENGEIIWTQVSVAPLALPDASAVVITQDITERKRATKELGALHPVVAPKSERGSRLRRLGRTEPKVTTPRFRAALCQVRRSRRSLSLVVGVRCSAGWRGL